MARSPLSTLAGLGVAGILLAVVLWLAALRQVSDPAAAAAAAAIDDVLAPNLVDGYATRVTMIRDGSGIDAPRRYVARYRPSAPLAADPDGLQRMALGVAEIVADKVGEVRAEVLVHCVAETGDDGIAQVCFRRSGAPGSWRFTAVETLPPLPSASGRLTPGTRRRAPSHVEGGAGGDEADLEPETEDLE